MNEAKWYVVHTRTGYENKVKTDLEKTVENRGMKDRIQEIRIPTEEVVEIKDGKRKSIQRKLYPCYIMVKMVMDSETWYVVRNASGVTGFVGPGSDPVPLSEEEVATMNVEREPVVLDILAGEEVRIVDGPLENFTGKVEEVDLERQKLRVIVNMFGRETPVDLDYMQVKKMF